MFHLLYRTRKQHWNLNQSRECCLRDFRGEKKKYGYLKPLQDNCQDIWRLMYAQLLPGSNIRSTPFPPKIVFVSHFKWYTKTRTTILHGDYTKIKSLYLPHLYMFSPSKSSGVVNWVSASSSDSTQPYISKVRSMMFSYRSDSWWHLKHLTWWHQDWFSND